MDLFDISSIKFKLLSFDELVINLDRLSRFKLPEYTYNRVFTDIITKFLISPKYSKKEIESLSPKVIALTVQKIWNESVKNCGFCSNKENYAYKALSFIINKTFCNIDNKTRLLMNTKLNISAILNKIDYNT
ncbi:MAG: hypothetical protein LUH05_00180, partial [Candidatus Gastranaerophilales bacterium]|nr:hypothetical protein [Candidatus Gastranaerophilales bacterium]